MTDSLQRVASSIGQAVGSFAGSLTAADEDVHAFVASLGFDLPMVPAAFNDLKATATTLMGSVTTFQSATLDLAEGAGTAEAVENAAATLLVDIYAFARALVDLPGLLRAQLPPPYIAATHIDEKIQTRLLETLVLQWLETVTPLFHDLLRFIGVADEVEQSANPAIFQPEFLQRGLRWDRLGTLFSDPPALFRDLYGWGTPTIDADGLFENLRRVTVHLGGMAEIEYPSQALLAAAAPGVPIPPDAGPQPLIIVPVLRTDLVDLALGVFPLPKANPAEIQGLGFTGRVTGHLDTSIPITERLSLGLETTIELTGGISLAIKPNQPPLVVTGFETGGAPFATGRAALHFLFANASHDPLRLLDFGGGSRLEIREIETMVGVEGTTNTPIDPFAEADIRGGKLVISASNADSFLAKILPPEGVQVGFDFGIGWSNRRGVYFSGGASLQTALPLHMSLGPINIDTLYLVLTLNPEAFSLETSVALNAAIGPVAASVDRLGVMAKLKFQEGNLGPVDLSFNFKPPNGLGIVVDAGPITGGGYLFLDYDAGRYAGVLQLQICSISVKAIGILDTKLPGGQTGYSFLIIISVEFPPVQLGFGFTLNGVGGLAGIHRTIVTEALQAGVRNGGVDHVLFPENPVQNATRIISDLQAFFPPLQDHYVFGPMAMIGWGTPTLVRIELAIILELPSPIRIVLLGQLSALLPTEDTAIVELHVDVLGIVDFGAKFFSLDGSLHDSRVALFSLCGDFAVRLTWGEDPSFALSIGGLNPHFQPPPNFPVLRRLTLALGTGDNPRISLQCYMALTSNSLQFGARAELYAEAAGFNIYGWIGFDVLVIYLPFSFRADFTAGFALRRGTSVIAGIRLDATLTGPTPWHAWGEATLSILFFDISVGFDVTFGEERHEELPPADVWGPMQTALQDARNWSAALPSAVARVVSLLDPPNATTVLVDPMGTMTVRERVAPLNRTLAKFGEAKPQGVNRFDLQTIKIGTHTETGWTTVPENFAPGQFENLTDDQKLSRPSFEKMDGGASLASDAVTIGGEAGTDVRYETIIIDSPWDSHDAPLYFVSVSMLTSLLTVSAAGLGGIRNSGLEKYVKHGQAPKVALDEEQFVIATADDLSLRRDIAKPASRGAMFAALEAHLAIHPEDRGRLQVVPRHYVEAA